MKLDMKKIRKNAFIIFLMFLFSSGILVMVANQFLQRDEFVILETTMGDIEIKLDREKAPVTVENFVKYVEEGFYDGLVFHRVMDGFMIQAGGFNTSGDFKPATRAPIVLESTNGLKNDRGTIAMARTSDPNSASTQFFINVVNNSALDYPSFDGYGYAVFGEVVEGMDVVDAIKAVEVESRFVPPLIEMTYWPVEDIIITRAYMKGN